MGTEPRNGGAVVGSTVAGTAIVHAASIPISGLSVGGPCSVTFPGYTITVSTLQYGTDPAAAGWTNVPGWGPERGAGGPMSLTDDHDLPATARFDRVLYSVAP